MPFLHKKLWASLSNDAKLIIPNVSWLYAEKVIRLSLGIYITASIARHLGPHQFGLLSYAIAFITLFSSIGNVGLPTITPKELVVYPHLNQIILGSTLLLKTAGGLIAILAICIITFSIDHESYQLKAIIVILSLSYLFRPFDIIRYHFESLTLSKHAAKPEIIAFIISSAIRLILIHAEAGVIYFAYSFLLEYILISIFLLYSYSSRKHRILSLRPSLAYSFALFKKSWPLILSGGLAVTISYSDRIMLQHIIGQEIVGQYSAATKLIEVCFFIPLAISASVAPSILSSKKISHIKYNLKIQRVYHALIIISIALSIVFFLLAKPIILLLYGGAYEESITILRFYSFILLFSFPALFRTRMMTIESAYIDQLFISILAAISNILFNLILILKFGAVGAAIASLLSWFCFAYLYPLLFKSSRKQVFLSLGPLFNNARTLSAEK